MKLKNEILLGCTVDFEMIESLLIGETTEQKTNNIFKNVDDFENCINAIGVDYHSEDVNFTGYLYKLNRLGFKKVSKSQNGRGTDFKQDIVEYIGKNCYFPTRGNCFIKCIIQLTGNDYMNEFPTLIRTEQRRSNFMTTARIQPCFKKHKISKG